PVLRYRTASFYGHGSCNNRHKNEMPPNPSTSLGKLQETNSSKTSFKREQPRRIPITHIACMSRLAACSPDNGTGTDSSSAMPPVRSAERELRPSLARTTI